MISLQDDGKGKSRHGGNCRDENVGGDADQYIAGDQALVAGEVGYNPHDRAGLVEDILICNREFAFEQAVPLRGEQAGEAGEFVGRRVNA
jgi:hypothetical protein